MFRCPDRKAIIRLSTPASVSEPESLSSPESRSKLGALGALGAGETKFPFPQMELFPSQTDNDSDDLNEKFHYSEDYQNETNWVVFRNPFAKVETLCKRVLITPASIEWQMRI